VIARGVEKSFKGKKALCGVSLSLFPGEILYVLGPNGSGKTTLVRTLLGLYEPDRGEIRVLGGRPGGSEWPRILNDIGYLPENADVYERLTGLEIIEFYARLRSRRRWREFVERAIEISGLAREDLARRAGGYSKGMRRRLLLAIAMMHEPRLLVLDEPFSGVDVISSHRMKILIERERGKGAGVLATSHNVLEAERYASRVLFIYRGRQVFFGTPRRALEVFSASNLEEAFVRAVTSGSSKNTLGG